MSKIIGVKFKSAGKVYYFDPLDLDIKRGMNVIVETSRGIEFGEVTFGVREVENSTLTKPLKAVLRIANEEDTARYKSNKEKEKEAYRICAQKIEQHKLDMKLIEVEYTFDGNKILFYFTADGRVDFRELVKDLAAVFRTRIELRQIGVRDESKALGSIGVCGRNLCCSQFLGEFVPVSIKMAKEQGLSLNPTKISGACGRLMCCLKYEQDMYEELIASAPKNGTVVNTPDGRGTIVNVALLRGRVRVRFEQDDEVTMKYYDVAEISKYDPNGDNKPVKPAKPKELAQTLEEDTADPKKQPRRRAANKSARQTSEKKTAAGKKQPRRPERNKPEHDKQVQQRNKNRQNRGKTQRKKPSNQN